jgi:crotonobetainyl-CoA:carnitine CoA-transferase CaiB-like acyl-CoA transferase
MSRKVIKAILNQCRVVDLTNEHGFLCGKILADLGAEVIKLEPPLGDPSRNIGPFYHDDNDPEKSLSWWVYNANKRSITLNILHPEGRDLLLKLIEQADIVIETFQPGHLDSLGLGYSELSQRNPSIILVSITSFGQTGPCKDYAASDITLMAMGGLMYLTGDPDLPPLRVSIPQSYLHAASDAAVATMIAYYHRQVTGEGQHVDVSTQASLLMTTMNAIPYWVLEGVTFRREGRYRRMSSGLVLPQIWQCKDGLITFIIFGGASGGRHMKALIDWMDSEGMATDYLESIDWGPLDFSQLTTEMVEKIVPSIQKFFMLHPKQELYEEAIRRGVMISPVATPAEILANPQFRSRDFWDKVSHPEIGNVLEYPGLPFHIEDISSSKKKRVPCIGEHNSEVYQDLVGLSSDQLKKLAEKGVI